MQRSTALPIQVSTSGFFPAPIRPLVQPLEPAMLKLFFPDTLLRSVHAIEPGADPSQFAGRLLEDLDIRYELTDRDRERIPSTGAALLVANHPFGFLEGLILLNLLEKIRPDYRIVANSVLASVSPIRERLILLNPFHRHPAPEENGRGLRDCMRWLHENGMLAMFPAGEVAHLKWSEQAVVDPAWNTTAARLARKMGCVVVPIYFEGANSIPFQLLGTLYPGLRTLSLPRELVKKRRQTIRIRVGSPIPATILKSYPADGEAATEYLRSRTFLLRSRSSSGELAAVSAVAIAPASSKQILLDELAALPADQIFASSQDFTVYCAKANQIPNILREIGRERELTFRHVGEGTKNSVDLDAFDDYYHHLFLWSNRDQKIAGGYRIVATPDVLPALGVKGLYTNTLFHYERRFFEQIGPALELGRSFICREYQRHYAPLLLLWKGIATYVQRRPECAVLFGAVSISGDYQAVSRELIVNYLNLHVTGSMKSCIKPRRGFRPGTLVPKDVARLSRMLSSLDELSSSISDVEGDGKGVPVLIRHYLKLGGQILGFNVDPAFSNALDALILVDLRVMTDVMLERCMGRAAAAEFRAYHSSASPP